MGAVPLRGFDDQVDHDLFHSERVLNEFLVAVAMTRLATDSRKAVEVPADSDDETSVREFADLAVTGLARTSGVAREHWAERVRARALHPQPWDPNLADLEAWLERGDLNLAPRQGCADGSQEPARPRTSNLSIGALHARAIRAAMRVEKSRRRGCDVCVDLALHDALEDAIDELDSRIPLGSHVWRLEVVSEAKRKLAAGFDVPPGKEIPMGPSDVVGRVEPPSTATILGWVVVGVAAAGALVAFGLEVLRAVAGGGA